MQDSVERIIKLLLHGAQSIFITSFIFHFITAFVLNCYSLLFPFILKHYRYYIIFLNISSLFATSFSVKLEIPNSQTTV